MKTEGQVRQKLKQVLYRHLQKKLRSLFRPAECKHNRQGYFQGRRIGLCGYKGRGMHKIVCDADVDGCTQQAMDCPWFDGRQTKESIKAAFKDIVQAEDRGRLAYEFPDAAALLWVLDDITDLETYLDILDNDQEPVVDAPAVPVDGDTKDE